MEAAEDAARELEAAGEGSITLQNLAAAVDKMIATARAGGNLELVAEACRDMADSCRAAASKQLLLGVLRSRVRMELLPIVLGFTWQLLADAVQHLGTASARVPTEALLQCLHDSALILLCVQNASFSAQAGSAESPRLIGQCLILGLCRSNVLSNIAALLLAVRAQQRHLDRGEDHGEDGQIICGALQAVMTNMGHALTTLLEQGGEGLGNPGALDLALFSLEHGSQVSSALAAVCLAASRDSRAILSGHPQQPQGIDDLRALQSEGAAQDRSLCASACRQLVRMFQHLVEAATVGLSEPGSALLIAKVLSPVVYGLNNLLWQRLALQRAVTAARGQPLGGANAAIPPDPSPAAILKATECLLERLKLCGETWRSLSRGVGRPQAGAPIAIRTLHNLNKVARCCLGMRPLAKQLGPLGVVDAEESQGVAKVHTTAALILQQIHGGEERIGMYDVLHARPVPGIGAVPLAAVAAAIQSQAAPAGANGAVLLEHVKALRQPTELICHAAAAQLTVHSLEVDADADDYELQRVERLLKAWDVPAGAKRGGADDAAAAAQELAVLHVALSAVRQATLRLTRKAKAISGASSSSCSSSSSSSGPSSASPVLAHQCLKQLHELLTSTLTRALRSLHRPQFRWSYTRGPQPGPRAPAVAVAATVQLLPALVAVTAGLASSACARLESSMSALRVASAAKEVEMANVDGVFETRRKVHQDCDAVKDIIVQSLLCIQLPCKGPFIKSNRSATTDPTTAAPSGGDGRGPYGGATCGRWALCQLLALQAAGAAQLMSLAANCIRQLAQAEELVSSTDGGSFSLIELELSESCKAGRACAAGMLQLVTAAGAAAAGALVSSDPLDEWYLDAVLSGAEPAAPGTEQHPAPAAPGFGEGSAGGTANGPGRSSGAAVAVSCAAAGASWCTELLGSGLVQAIVAPDRPAGAADGLSPGTQPHKAGPELPSGVALTSASPGDQLQRLNPMLDLLGRVLATLSGCAEALTRGAAAADVAAGSVAERAAGACARSGPCSHALKEDRQGRGLLGRGDAFGSGDACASGSGSASWCGAQRGSTAHSAAGAAGGRPRHDQAQTALLGCSHALDSAVLALDEAVLAVEKCERDSSVPGNNDAAIQMAEAVKEVLQASEKLQAARKSNASQKQKEALLKRYKLAQERVAAAKNVVSPATQAGRLAAARAVELTVRAVGEAAGAAQAIQAASKAVAAVVSGGAACSEDGGGDAVAATLLLRQQCALGHDWGLLTTQHPFLRDSAGLLCGNPLCEGPTCTGGDGVQVSSEQLCGMASNKATPCPEDCGVRFCCITCLDQARQHGHALWCGLFARAAAAAAARATAVSYENLEGYEGTQLYTPD